MPTYQLQSVTVKVRQLTDEYPYAALCDTSLTGLSTCNLRSAWKLCNNMIASMSCTVPQSYIILLPAGSISYLDKQYGIDGLVSLSRPSCKVALSIASSSEAVIQGDISSAPFLNVINAYSLLQINLLNLFVSGFGDGSPGNTGSIYLRNADGITFKNVAFYGNHKYCDEEQYNSKSAVNIYSSKNVLIHNCTFSNNCGAIDINDRSNTEETSKTNYVISESTFRSIYGKRH